MLERTKPPVRIRSRAAARVALVLAVAASLAVSSTPAFAQPKPGTPEAAKQADELFLEGKALLKAGRKREARDKYLAALALKKSYDVSGNLGNVELEMGLYRDAAEHLSYALRTYATSGSTAEQIEKARQRLAEAKRHVAAVSVAVSVDGAEVVVDGVSVGRAPLMEDVFVDPGARLFEARLGGHMPAKQMIEAAAGAATSVTLTVVPMAQGSGPSDGAQQTPKSPNGEKDRGATSSGVGPLVIGGLVATGVAAVLGVSFAIVSTGKAQDADDKLSALQRIDGSNPCNAGKHPVECAEVLELRETRDALGDLAVWSFIAAGLVGGGTAAYAFLAPRPAAKKSALWMAPAVGAQGGGLVVTGQW